MPRLPIIIYTGIGSASLIFVICWSQLATPDFFDRAIGGFILDEVKTGARNLYYMAGIVIAFCFLSVITWVTAPEKLASLRYRSLSSSTFTPVFLLASIAVANAIFYLIFHDAVYSKTLGLIVLFCLVQAALVHFIKSETSLAIGIWIQVLAYQLSLSTLLLFSSEIQFNVTFVALFLSFVFIFYFLYTRTENAVYWTYPLAWTPMIPIVANEASYFLSQRFGLQVDIDQVGGLFFATSIVMCANGYRRCSSTSIPSVSKKTFILRRYLPAVVLSSVALVEYLAFSTYTGFYDNFHLGEAILPMQQWSQYGAIPYIDYYPVHGLFDLFPQILYVSAFGYQGLEITTWGQGYMMGWLPRMLAAAIFFVFFSRFWGRVPTALLMLFLPTYHLIHPYYVFLLLAAFALYRLPTTPKKIMPWFVVWFSVLFLALWRIDFGIAALAGCMAVTFLVSWQKQSANILLASFLAAALVLLPAILLFTLTAILKEKSPIVIVEQIIQYAQIQLPVGSYIEFVKEYNLAALLQLVLLPMISVVAMVVMVNRSFFLRLPLGRLELVLVFLAVSSLVISFRSLQRHSLAEGVFNPYLFVFIGLSLLGYLPRKKLGLVQSILVAGIGVSVIVLPKSSDVYSAIYYNFGADKEYPVLSKDYRFSRWDEKPLTNGNRVDDRVRRNNVINFLKQELEGDQTFYDFTNSPLLYALADRQLPNYIFETVYHTSETFQRHTLEELDNLRAQNRLPLVLFKQNNMWDEADGVNTVIRSYRIAEYLYKHYQPCLRIDNYDVWTQRTSARRSHCVVAQGSAGEILPKGATEIAGEHLRQALNVGYLPRLLATTDPLCALCQKSVYNFEIEPVENESTQLILPSAMASNKQATYLVLEVAAAQATRLKVGYANSSITLNVKASDTPLTYVVRLSMLYEWWLVSNSVITVSSNHPIGLAAARLLEAD